MRAAGQVITGGSLSMRVRSCLTALLVATALGGAAGAQTLTPLVNPPPADGVVYGFLMTDGTVLMQGGGPYDWYRLTPDINGSYVNGAWSAVASLPAGYGPSATGGGVLPDGRVLITGGEYNYSPSRLTWIFALDTNSAVYDPVRNTWTEFPGPAGWIDIGDSPGTVLANGQFLLGEKTTTALALLNASTLTWTVLASSGKADENAEEGWTLMPDGSVLTADVTSAPNSERLDTSRWTWSSLGGTVANLKFTWTGSSAKPIPWVYDKKTYFYKPAGEIGPAILRPDGTVFATGAINTVPKLAYNAHTAIYTPSAKAGGVGVWTAGPDFAHGDDAGDQFAVLLPNGHVLVEANVGGGDHDRAHRVSSLMSNWLRHARYAPRVTPLGQETAGAAPAGAAPDACVGPPPFHLYEFDGVTMTLEPMVLNTCGVQPNLLVLPTGETLVGGFAVYRSPGSPNPSWAPTISSAPKTIARGQSYPLTGTQLTGLSQANAFGDEFPAPTNYPLVRLTNTRTGHVVYCRTHDWSNSGVATGALPVTTDFDVPAKTELGPSQLEVVANGVASAPVSVTVR
jgi:hypothetical protein